MRTYACVNVLAVLTIVMLMPELVLMSERKPGLRGQIGLLGNPCPETIKRDPSILLGCSVNSLYRGVRDSVITNGL